MRDDQHRFLSLLGQLPARLTAEQVAWVLNCQAGDVPILVVARLLKPLGNPAHNSVKYFKRVRNLTINRPVETLADADQRKTCPLELTENSKGFARSLLPPRWVFEPRYRG
jgi:hypothetical protein